MAQRAGEVAGYDEDERQAAAGRGGLAAFARADDVEKVRESVARSRGEIEATVAAIKERLTLDHIKWAASDTLRQAAGMPRTGRAGVMVVAAVAFALVAAKAVSFLRRRRREKRRTL